MIHGQNKTEINQYQQLSNANDGIHVFQKHFQIQPTKYYKEYSDILYETVMAINGEK